MIVLRKSTIGIVSVPETLCSGFKSTGLDTLNGIHDQYFNFCFSHSLRDSISCATHRHGPMCRHDMIRSQLTSLSD